MATVDRVVSSGVFLPMWKTVLDELGVATSRNCLHCHTVLAVAKRRHALFCSNYCRTMSHRAKGALDPCPAGLDQLVRAFELMMRARPGFVPLDEEVVP